MAKARQKGRMYGRLCDNERVGGDSRQCRVSWGFVYAAMEALRRCLGVNERAIGGCLDVLERGVCARV